MEAVEYLLNQSGALHRIEDRGSSRRHNFTLPEDAADNSRIRAYLSRARGISTETIDRFIDAGLIYEEAAHHNVVFVGKDISGVPRFATMRGIYDYRGKPFKCDVKGNDKAYGFHYEVAGSDTVRVFEGAMDLLSFFDVTRLTSDHLLALGMTADKPLDKYLSDRKDIKNIILSLDNDEPGINAAKVIEDKYKNLGYTIKNLGSPVGYKDYNEWLMATRMREQAIPQRVRVNSKAR